MKREEDHTVTAHGGAMLREEWQPDRADGREVVLWGEQAIVSSIGGYLTP
ncbi:hypothetical protein [Aeromonas salmonicida]|nr:hypothetical protein [Aeromonas salmonicida]MDM5114521.1 hypothetical protein [Aeromonas salmonicida]